LNAAVAQNNYASGMASFSVVGTFQRFAAGLRTRGGGELRLFLKIRV
jgi:hypothetical protein